MENAAKNGAPGESRTPNLLIRSQMLYPIELRVRVKSKSEKEQVIGPERKP